MVQKGTTARFDILDEETAARLNPDLSIGTRDDLGFEQ